MRVGDYIKHIDDNTGEGPDGCWVIESFGHKIGFGEVLIFGDETWCEVSWIKSEIECGNAIHTTLPNGMVPHRIKKHKF